MKSEVILNTFARKQLYHQHHASSLQAERKMTSDNVKHVRMDPSDDLTAREHGRCSSLSPPQQSETPGGLKHRNSPERVHFIPVQVEHIGTDSMKQDSHEEVRSSYQNYGPGLYANILHLQNGNSPESVHHTSIGTVRSVGLNLSTSNFIDSPIVSPVSTPVINEDNSMQHSPSPSQMTDPLVYAKSSSPTELYDCRWLKCDKNFLSMDDLVNHVNDYHVKVERPDVDYQCKWDGCPRKGKGFNARYKMLIHIRTHTNEKPHRCTLCGKCFSRLENLKIHYRSHTGEKPYICPVQGCNKAYSNSSDRFKHVRTHQEEKPYICKMPGCNKRYTDPSSLRKHVRTHGHYFREGNEKQKFKLSPSLPQPQPMFPSSKMQVSSPVSPINPMMTLSPNKLLTHSMASHIHPLHNILHVSNFTSNPMLSSTILMQSSATQTISTQTEGVVVSLSPNSLLKVDINGEKLEEDDKCQDGPLDLSTSPSTESDILVGHRDGSNFSTAKWELINS